MSFEFPIVDLAPLRNGNAARFESTVEKVRHAGEDVGWLIVMNHGIDAALVDEMYAVTRAFFDLDESEKLRWQPARPEDSRGYMPLRSRALAYSRGEITPPDLVEFFAIGQPAVDRSDPYYAPHSAGVHFLPNIWPEAPATFRDVWTRYYAAVEGLSVLLMRTFALALGLQPGWFDDKIDRHCSNLFANNYPDYDGPIEPGQVRLGAHTDYGSLTIVHQDDGPGGLEVFLDGEWRAAPIVPGAFIVNIGDLLARWTNDRWVSTLHRVKNPDAGGTRSTRRISIPFFHQPNYDALIECIPTCLAPGEAPKYPPILSGVNMTEKTNATLRA